MKNCAELTAKSRESGGISVSVCTKVRIITLEFALESLLYELYFSIKSILKQLMLFYPCSQLVEFFRKHYNCIRVPPNNSEKILFYVIYELYFDILNCFFFC